MNRGKCSYVVALAVLSALSLVCMQGALAGVGVYNWAFTPDGGGVPVTISYRLNMTADVTIQILNSGGSVIRTLGPFAGEAKGLHSHTWNGAGAPLNTTANYGARIMATAGAVTALTPVFTATGSYHGIAVDNNPASPGYGNVYLANATSKNIECYYADGTSRWNSSTGWGGSSAPWGAGVDANGRVHTASRSAVSGVANGVEIFDYLGGRIVVPGFANQLNQSWTGVVRPSDSSPFTVSITNGTNLVLVKTMQLKNDYSGIVTGGVWTNWINIPVGVAPVDNGVVHSASFRNLTGDSAECYVGFYGITGGANGSRGDGFPGAGVQKWTGTIGSADWVMSQQILASDWVSGCSVDPQGNYVWVSLEALNTASEPVGDPAGCVKRIKLSDLSRETFTMPASYAHHNAADAVGNCAIIYGSGTYNAKWPAAAMFAPPDAGSSDSRETAKVSVVIPTCLPMEITSATAVPATIKQNGADASLVTIRVTDAGGVADIKAVSIDLSRIGGSATQAVTSFTNVDALTRDYTISVTAAPGTWAGVESLPITVEQFCTAIKVHGSVTLTVTGGSISGIINHHSDAWGISGATVVATDGTHSYSATTDATGAYSLAVNTGTFAVSASKTGYKTGALSTESGVGVALDGAAVSSPKLYGLTVAEVYALPRGTKCCVEAIVSGQPSATVAAPYGPQWGFPGKYSLADSTGGIWIIDTVNKPIDGDSVAVAGTFNLSDGNIYQVGVVTNFASVSSGNAIPPATVGNVDMFNDNPGGGSIPDWGKLVGVTGMKVDVVTPATDYWDLTVSDASGGGGIVRLWKNANIQATDVPAVNAIVSYIGVIGRQGPWLINTLEPRNVNDLKGLAVDVTTIAGVRDAPDGLTINLTAAKVVTGVFTDHSGSFVYIEETDRTMGIRVQLTGGTGTIVQGDTITVKGQLNTFEGERRIVADNADVVETGTADVPFPLAMPNKHLGGGPTLGYVAGVKGQGGVTGGVGTNNIGLLGTSWGRVGPIPPDPWAGMDYYFKITDGSGGDVWVFTQSYSATEGNPVVVTGVISCLDVGAGNIVRVIRPRSDTDIVEFFQ